MVTKAIRINLQRRQWASKYLCFVFEFFFKINIFLVFLDKF